MYKIKKVKTHEIVHTAETLKELLISVQFSYANHDFIEHEVKFKDLNGRIVNSLQFSNKSIILDHDDLIVPLQEIKEVLNSVRKEYSYKHYSKFEPYDHDKDFRNGPVPSTGKKSSYRNYFRHMRTTSERRISAISECDEELLEYGVRIRGRRNHKNLPNAWDDEYRRDINTRNWKKYRKHQWR